MADSRKHTAEGLDKEERIIEAAKAIKAKKARLQEEAEEKRRAKEAKEKRKAEEAEAQRVAEEARKAEEAEEAQKAEEAAKQECQAEKVVSKPAVIVALSHDHMRG
jgi:hypothetical protein